MAFHTPKCVGSVILTGLMKPHRYGNPLVRLLATKAQTAETHHVTLAEACPQGIQGEEDANLSTWFNTCQRYGLENCEHQLQGIQSGRKTLYQVLAEQDALIREIAENYRANINQNISIQGVQENIGLPNLDMPCPQGVQGEECAQFKLWLQNCHRFGFQNCLDQLELQQTGRKSLADIFREQDEMIRDVVNKYQKRQGQDINKSNPFRDSTQKRDFSSLQDTNRHINLSPYLQTYCTKPEEEPGKLSQIQQLRKAVKEYGGTVMVFHITISLVSLGGFYTAVVSGLDVVGMMTALLGPDTEMLNYKLVHGATNFAIAYAVHKIFAPVRIAITLTSAPLIVRYLRKRGILKQPKVSSK